MADVTEPVTAVEDPKTPAAAPEGVPAEGAEEARPEGAAPEASEGAKPEGTEDAEPSAADLQARITALEQENADLKKEPEGDEGEPEPAPSTPTARDPALRYFVTATVAETKKAFAKAETADEQVDVLLNSTDKFVAAVFADRQDPLNRGLAQSIIEVANGQELLELLITPQGTVDTKLASLAPQIKKSLSKMSWADRSKPGVVTGLYHQLVGKATTAPVSGAPAKKPAGPVLQSPAVKDAAAGAGTGGIRRPASKVTLNAEQEEERQTIEAEGGHPYPPEKYLASLKALQDAAKQNGRKVPATLRRL